MIELGITPVHVGLSIIVDQHRGVNIVPMLLLPHERLADWISERTIGGIADKHAYAIAVKRAIHIVFTVAVHHLLGPGSVVAATPLEILK